MDSPTIWTSAPSAATWEPHAALVHGAPGCGKGRFVPLESLLREVRGRKVRQGVSANVACGSGVRARLVRPEEVWPLLRCRGEPQLLAEEVVNRHARAAGDLLVARVGRLGETSFVGQDTLPVVPRSELLAASPANNQWSAGLAAALSTSTARRAARRLAAGTALPTLNADTFGQIPVPDPGTVDYKLVAGLGDRADQLVHAALQAVDDVRLEINLTLERVPIAIPERPFWFRLADHERGWSWRDVCGEQVRQQALWAASDLRRLGDLLRVADHRPKTVALVPPQVVLESGNVRADWYLAIPDYTQASRRNRGVKMDETVPRRFYEITDECLLVPLVGDVEAAPVVLARPWLQPELGPVAVPMRWLPLTNLRWPRTLALLLDQPLVRLQRQLSAAYSTPQHLTHDAVERLLLPHLADDDWARFERRLRTAQERLLKAYLLAGEALRTAEAWYA